MQSDADKRCKYSIYQRQIKAQMGVKLRAFFAKERLAIWQRYKYPNHHLDHPKIWFVLVSTLFDRVKCERRCMSQTYIVIHTLVTPA
jgi:hypothetical protein